jgi:hypothetical protein
MYYDSNLVWFFLAYMAISALGLINLVIGVIVEHTTVDGKKQDIEEQRAKGLETLGLIARLRDLLGHDGVVNTAHLHAAKFDPEIQEIMQELQLDHEKFERLFQMLDVMRQGVVDLEDLLFALVAMAKVLTPSQLQTITLGTFARLSKQYDHVQEKIRLLLGEDPDHASFKKNRPKKPSNKQVNRTDDSGLPPIPVPVSLTPRTDR